MRQLAEDVVKAERKRCIRAVLDMHCKFCGWHCKYKANNFNNVEDTNCDEREKLRKAIEEGGNENESKTSKES